MELLSAFVIMSLGAKLAHALTYEAAVMPIKYNIFLTPYIDNDDGNKVGTYDCTTEIYIRSKKKGVKYFDIPSYEILYNDMVLRNIETDDIIPIKFNYGTHSVSFEFDEELDDSVLYLVELSFNKHMGDGNALMWDIYVDYTGHKNFVVWTEMGRSDANSAFPCFTEPYYRTIFEISLVVPVGYDGYANGARYDTSLQDISDRYHLQYLYQQTIEIPTYLVSVVVLKSNQKSDKWLQVRIVNESPDKSTRASENILFKALQFYESTFKRTYLSFGAATFLAVGHYRFYRNSFKQSWGVIIFDEELLTTNGDITTMEDQIMKKKLSSAVSQIWYANIISPQSWSDSWVTRALTKYYEYFGTHAIYPKLHLDVQFVTEEMHPVMWLENYNVQLLVKSNSFFTQDYSDSMINSWLYGKAACLIRMFSHAMTQPRFTDMMTNFIAKNFSGTFTDNDLKQSLMLYWPSTSNFNGSKLFDLWLFSIDVPAINVSISDDKKSVRFTRLRGCIYVPVPENFPAIPLTYITDKMPNSTDTFSYVYMHHDEDTATVNFTEPIKWVIANNHRVGLYRVLYAESAYELFKKELMKADHSRIHQLNRAQLIDDMFYFHLCRFVTPKTLLNFLQYLRNESDYAPWKAAMEGFIHISSIMDSNDLPYLEEFVWFLSENIHHDLGMFPQDNETVLQKHLRNLILNTNCRFRLQNISDRAMEMVLNLTKTHEKDIPREILTTIICCGVRRITNEQYNMLLKIYAKDEYVKYTRNLFDGLACTHSPLSLERFFNVTTKELRVAEREAIFTKILRENPNNAWFLYFLLTKDFYKLLDTFQNKMRMVHVLRDIGIYIDDGQFLHWEAYMDRNIEQYPQVVKITTTVHYARRFHKLWKSHSNWDFKEYLRNKTWLPLPVVPPVVLSGSTQNPAFLKFFMIFLIFKYCFLILAELVG